MAEATLTISSRNYSSWSLRGWLLAKMSGLDFDVEIVSLDDPATRAELLLLSPSMLVPCLRHDGLSIWNNLAIGEYLHEIRPQAGILPPERDRRARCRSISGEMQAGFAPLRSALPMNLKASFPTFRVFSRAQADIDRITTIWRDCLAEFGGPWLLGAQRSMADAMYAPVATRFRTYHVPVDPICQADCDRVLDMPEMREWDAAARAEPDEIEELEMEF
ncbi:MAG: glutathione S-transferase family protein [Beijerinckiaceae bacterium]|nr:glutathione S-transferase family protein [Beijerinckiaceae bacterium]